MTPSFFETIRLQNGQVQNLDWHQERVNATWKAYFSAKPIVLQKALAQKEFAEHQGRWRIRLEYNQRGVQNILCEPYTVKMIDSLYLYNVNQINYPWKSCDRQDLDQHPALPLLPSRTELVFCRNCCLIEGRYAALIAQHQNTLYTSQDFLLPSTTVARLIANRQIFYTNFSFDFIQDCQWIGLINAMLDIGEIKIAPKQIFCGENLDTQTFSLPQ